MTLTPRISRRGALASGAAIALTALAACSSSSSSSSSGPAASDGGEQTSGQNPYMPPAEGKTSYPLELPSAFGTSTLEARPTRVAAITRSQDDAEALAALGVTPYLANEFTDYVWLDDAIPTPIAERYSRASDDYPLEQIAAAKPDLIVAFGNLGPVYDQLKAIAPVLASGDNATEAKKATDWEQVLTSLGKVLDLQDVAAAALKKWDDFWGGFKDAHPAMQGKTISYLVYYGDQGGLQVHSTPGSPAGNVFEDMGMALAPGLSSMKYRQELSAESYDLADADVILFSDNSNGRHEDITKDPLFMNLNAVKNEHVVIIDNKAKSDPSDTDRFVIDGEEQVGNVPWALARSGPLSSTWAAEKIAPAIEKRVS